MKKRFHRFGLWIVLILLLSSLTAGCAPKAPDPSASAGASTSDPTSVTANSTQPNKQAATEVTDPGHTEPTVPPVNDPYPQYVQTDINEIVISYNRYGEKNWETPISIPKLLPFSEDASVCQKEIADYYTPIVEEIRSNAADGLSLSRMYIEHKVFLNEDILSVVIHELYSFDFSVFRVYNFDVESGKRLDTDALMGKVKIADYTEKITQTAKRLFETEYSEFPKDTFYNQQLETTLSSKNLDKAMAYIAEDGTVMVVVNIYALAGAAYYTHAVPLA